MLSHKLKKIDELIDEVPILSKEMFKTCKWASSYYHHPIGQVIFSVITPLHRKKRKEPKRKLEIIHHETIGSNHFVEILGKRKFEIQEILSPALPPFSDELMQDLVPEEGIYPDLETILTKIPEESEYHKLYLAATVDYIEQKLVIEDEKLEELKSLLKIIISRIGSNLQIDIEIIDEWVESRIALIFENQDDLLYNIAAMTVAQLENKYQILIAEDSDEIYDLIMENLVKIA